LSRQAAAGAKTGENPSPDLAREPRPRKRPEAYRAVAFLVSVARATDLDNLRDNGIPPAFSAMLEDMIARGYDPMEVMTVIRRLCRVDRRARRATK
jgi:hypothetical protein